MLARSIILFNALAGSLADSLQRGKFCVVRRSTMVADIKTCTQQAISEASMWAHVQRQQCLQAIQQQCDRDTLSPLSIPVRMQRWR